MMTNQHPNPEHQWYVRPYRPGDEEALLALYPQVFGRSRSPEELRWKLLSRHAAFPTMFVAALRDESALVGHYGGIPLQLKLGDGVVPSVHAVEAMTHPDYRRQGMLTALGEAAHSTWAEAGQAFVTGLPNEQWGTRNYALGYRAVFPLSWLRFPLKLDRAVMRRTRLPAAAKKAVAAPLRAVSWAWRTAHGRRAAGGYHVARASEADAAAFDEVWRHVSPAWPNAVVRNAGWVTWRYLQAEPRPYTVLIARDGGRAVGYVAYRLGSGGGRRNGYIADLWVRPDEEQAALALVSGALDDLDRQGAGTVMTLAPPRSPLYRTIGGLGFLPTRRATSFSFELVPLQPSSRLDDLRNPAEWLLAGGDFDVI